MVNLTCVAGLVNAQGVFFFHVNNITFYLVVFFNFDIGNNFKKYKGCFLLQNIYLCFY